MLASAHAHTSKFLSRVRTSAIYKFFTFWPNPNFTLQVYAIELVGFGHPITYDIPGAITPFYLTDAGMHFAGTINE